LCTEVVAPASVDVLDPYTLECFIPYEDKNDDGDNHTYVPNTSGGAISSQGGPLAIHHSAIHGNSASGNGGAISARGPLKMWNNTVYNNTSTAGSGGAVAISGDANTAESLILNNTFRSNSANQGSALYSALAPVRSTGSLYVEDSCSVPAASEALRKFNVTAGTDASEIPLDSCGLTGDPLTTTNIHVTVASLNIQDTATVNNSQPANAGEVRTFALGQGSSALNVFSNDSLELADEADLINDDARGVLRKNAAAGFLIDAGAYELSGEDVLVTTTGPTGSRPSGPVTLLGSLTPQGLPVTNVKFYLTTTPGQECAHGLAIAATPASIGAFDSATSVSVTIDDLAPNTTYYFCVVGETVLGVIGGEVKSFTTADFALDLNLNLGANSSFSGATTSASGSGLMPLSFAYLYLYSTPKLIHTFSVDSLGNFTGNFVISGCEASGDHKFRIEGIAPNGSTISDEVYFVLDPNCKIQAQSGVQIQGAAITVEDVLFANKSAILTAKYKKILQAWVPLLKGASAITISGFTETLQPTKAAINACKSLSQRRAKAVQKYLKSLGVDVKFVLKGYGATKPVSKKQALNRRATIQFSMIYGR
jgi:outer membrane protein OmpA-like peptidoglycan-associated protein